jgi:hypothetical protein
MAFDHHEEDLLLAAGQRPPLARGDDLRPEGGLTEVS